MIFYSLGSIHGFVLEASGDLGKIKPDELKLLCLSVFFPESTRLSLCSQRGGNMSVIGISFRIWNLSFHH